MPDPSVYIVGLKEFRADLKAIDAKAPRALSKGLKDAMRPVVSEAASMTPRRSGRLAGSLRPYSTVKGAGVRSPLPYANVIHWGGTTGHGHSRTRPGATRIKASKFAVKAAEKQMGGIEKSVAKAIDALARQHGFN